MKLTSLFSIIATSLFLAACGEAFTGKFGGDATILPGTCAGQKADLYYMEANVSVSGSDVELTIVKLVNKATQQPDNNSYYVAAKPAGAALSNQTSFYVQDQAFTNTDQVTVTMGGQISAARDEITQLSFTVNQLRSDGSLCRVTVTSPKLTIIN